MDPENSRTNVSENESNKTPLLIMTVDIGEDCKDNLTIFPNSCIEEVVQKFVSKHGLSQDQEDLLINQVNSHLNDENCEPNELSRNQYFEQWSLHMNKHLSQHPANQPRINKNSIRIMQQKQVLPVYERLYSLSNKHQNQPSEVKIKKSGTQCGNRLYNNWMVKKQQSERERSKILEQKEQEVTKSLTFKPEINKNVRISYFKEDPVQFQKLREETLERKRFEQFAKEQESCTFVPQINPFSENLLQNKFKIKPKSKCIELYEEAYLRKEKNEELVEQYYESQYQFRPEFSSVLSVDLEDHIERLHTSRKETEEYLQNKRKELNQLVDPNTGQDFFKPKVGRPPKHFQRELPISEYLYRMKDKKCFDDHKPSQLDLVSKSRSSEILVKRKRARYLEIFKLINPNECEKIYTEVIDLKNLNPEICKIMGPLLQELDETGEKLDFEEFFDSMENLCKVLTPEERCMVLKDKAKYEPRFVETKRGSASVGRMYSRNMKYKEEIEAKLIMERQKKSDDELKECTFKPKIKNYRRQKTGKVNYSWLDF